jgi:glycosyltransferase involved in cell wall biosynthesis
MILFIANSYPFPKRPYLGPFVKSQSQSLVNLGYNVDVFNVAELGYFKSIALIIKTKYKKYKVIHCHQGLMFLILFFFRPDIVIKKKVIVSLQNNLEYEFATISRLINYFLKQVFVVTVNFSNSVIIEKNSRFKRKWKNYFVLPNGVDIKKFKIIPKTECLKKIGLADKKYILFVSSTNRDRSFQKGEDIFDDVLKQFSKLNSDYEVLKIRNVNQELMPYYYGLSTMLISTSRYEGSANGIKEALACGLPVLASDAGDSRELIRNVSHCHICLDKNEFVNYLSFFHKFVIDRNEIRKSFLLKKLSLKKVAEKLCEIYFE